MSLTSKRPDISSFKDLATDFNKQLTNLKGTFTERLFMVIEQSNFSRLSVTGYSNGALLISSVYPSY